MRALATTLAFEEAMEAAERHAAISKPSLPSVLSPYAVLLRKIDRLAKAKTVELRREAISRALALQDSGATRSMSETLP